MSSKKWCAAAARPSGRGRAIEFGSRMQGGGSIIELARKPVASARTEWAARLASTRPVWNYMLLQCKSMYYPVVLNIICAQFDHL
jgi:hypothetical protein